MKPILIIKAGRSFPSLVKEMGDFDEWVQRYLTINGEQVPTLVVDPQQSTDFPDKDSISGVVITGSHAMASENAEWMDNTIQWLKEVIDAEIPALGICFGHHLLTKALGGEIDYHPGGIEIGSVRIRLLPEATQDPLFSQLPEKLLANTSHRQTVVERPDDIVILAVNDFDPLHAFRYGKCCWGLQFHPEFDAKAMQAYLHLMTKELHDDGVTPQDFLAVETPEAATILPRFAEYAMKE